MKAHNNAQRKQSFLRFSVTFLLLFLVLFGAIYFGYQVPIKENSFLNERVIHQEKLLLFQQEFNQLNNDVVLLMDTLDVAGVNAEVIEGRITAKIQQMDGLIQTYDEKDKPYYMTIVKGLSQHKSDKKTLKLGGNKEQEIADYEKRLAQLEQNRDEWKSQSEKLQMQLQLMNK